MTGTPEPLQYPTAFPIKLFLKPDPAAEAEIVALLQAALDAGNQLEAARKLSSKGGYACLSLTYTAQNEAEVARLRQIITSDPRVILSI